ncbi:MAG: response regulator [FCB group bacterium]|nr:response regulator [FCB group bacterium]
MNFKTVLENLRDVMLLCDENFIIREYNHSTEFMYTDNESIAGKKCFEVLRDREKPCEDCPLVPTLESGSLIPVDYLDKRFGEYFEERTHPVMTGDNTLEGFLLVLRNITKTHEIVDQSAQQKKLAAIGQISSGIAHDFNNVLTGVLGHVELMKLKNPHPEMLNHLKMIELAVQDGKATVRQMQDFTRQKKDKFHKIIDLKHLILDVVALAKPRWSKALMENGIIVEPVLNLKDEVNISGNKSDLSNAITNMLFNATDAMPDGGVITISTRARDGYAILQIKDTGIGMTKEIQEKIFDPFFTTKGVNGVGLGMSEVFGVVQRHNGEIKVSSQEGKGTQFTLRFPLSKKRPAVLKQRGKENFIPLNILAVDDESYVLEVLSTLLVRFGHTVTTHLSAGDAIKDFSENEYNLVITDLGMPEMSGKEVAAKIKSVRPGIPVILLSGWAMRAEDDSSIQSVIDIVVSKPFTVEEIEEAVYQSMKIANPVGKKK